ncbi:sn-glycerol-3-phosphate transport system permease protein UgpE [Frondihabitans sucicola]|uniref:Sn-glycerol-3-phosphate transport system permease protein UgpE n=1 Tax=Frondihabitans sucicola TaxID=1268041 RepID=A0ABM8GTW1_9MICO|nr:carbohydrate ABC transporter permease [Frondihabitans sucicola]BDZ51886.1 sn-glycerol-3-phosphate transport system permease protein UgpE [Frondihabitans sucicola]
MNARVLHASRWILIAVAVVVSLFPFVWMVRTSLAPAADVASGRFWLSSFDFGNFARAWTKADLGQSVATGIIVTLSIVLLQLVTCVPAAYVLAKVPFRGRNVALGVVLGCLLVPTQVTLIPLFIGVNLAGLADSLPGLVVPFMTSAFGIFLLRQQMMSIPDGLLEAARTDGLGHFQTLRRVVVPMAGPGIAAFSVFSVFTHWNDYMWPLLIARSPSTITPPLALAIFQQGDTGFDYPALAAGAVIVTAPVVILFLVAQRRFVQGMSGAEIPG